MPKKGLVTQDCRVGPCRYLYEMAFRFLGLSRAINYISANFLLQGNFSQFRDNLNLTFVQKNLQQ